MGVLYQLIVLFIPPRNSAMSAIAMIDIIQPISILDNLNAMYNRLLLEQPTIKKRCNK